MSLYCTDFFNPTELTTNFNICWESPLSLKSLKHILWILFLLIFDTYADTCLHTENLFSYIKDCEGGAEMVSSYHKTLKHDENKEAEKIPRKGRLHWLASWLLGKKYTRSSIFIHMSNTWRTLCAFSFVKVIKVHSFCLTEHDNKASFFQGIL